MVEIDVNKVSLKRYIKLAVFRLLVLAAHYLAVMDGLASMAHYPTLKEQSKAIFAAEAAGGNATVDNITTTTTTLAPSNVATTKIVRPATIGFCNMKKKIKEDELSGALLNFNMSLFLLFGFYSIAIINFIFGIVVNLRICICPVVQIPDACGRVEPTAWDKARDNSFNLASAPCDMGVMSCIVGLYAVKRGADGLACWECFMTPKCVSEKELDAILFMSSLALNVNFILVLAIVFYKGFITYYRATDPEKCDCHCVVPRCVTGCFVSLTVTCVVMMPPFLVMSTKVFSRKGYELGFTDDMMEKMMLVGIIIWVVVGIGVCIVMPLKTIMMRGAKKK